MRLHRSLVLAAGLLALAACGGKEQAAAPPPPEVGVIGVKSQTVPLTRDLVGRLSPYRSADARARARRAAATRLRGRQRRARRAAAVRDRPGAAAGFAGRGRGQLAQAEATYANARAAAQRARQLAPQKFVSQNDLDNAVASERSAGAAVEAARATVRNAQIDLGYAKVTAPIAGRAGKQRVTEGALVGRLREATLLTTVDQLDPLFANFSISSTELARLRSASNVSLAAAGKATVQIVLPGDRLHEQPGVVDFSDTTVDPETGAVSLRALVPNPAKALFPGSFVTLKVNLGELHEVFLVPRKRYCATPMAHSRGWSAPTATSNAAISPPARPRTGSGSSPPASRRARS